MAIIYITNARVPTEKAHGLQIAKTLEALVLAGESIRLVLPERRNYISKDLFAFYSIGKSFPVRYLSNPFWFLEKYSTKYYFSFQRLYFGLQAFFFVQFAPEQVVYTRDITLAFFLSVFSSKVIVYEDHEPKKSLVILQKLFLSKIKKKVLVAQNLVDNYKSFGVDPKTYKVIPNGVDLSEFEMDPDRRVWENLGIKNYKKIVLYVGSLAVWKGVDTLMASAKLLGDGIRVVMVGGDKTEDRDNLHVRPFVAHNEVVKYLMVADCLVLPNTAKEERSAYFTTPLKLFEYMASGVPILASDIPSFRPYLRGGENAQLFEPDNANDLAKQIKFVIDNSDYGNKLATKARKDVEQYTWSARANKILVFLRA